MPDFDSRPDTWRHIHLVQEMMLQAIQNMQQRAQDHDQSKLEDPELALFNEMTPKLAKLTFGSPEYYASLEALKPALAHHYARNTHHPEHYADGVNDMDLLDVLEMLADWKAASVRQHDGNILKSLEANKKRFGIDAQLARILENTIERMGWHK